MRESEPATDLQKVVETFLDLTKQHRSKAVYQRYSNAMELLMSYLAVNLLDPDGPPGGDKSPAGTLEELTPDLLRSYTSEFLMDRISGDRRTLKRHLMALRAFVFFLLDKNLIEKQKGKELSTVIRGAIASLKHFDNPFTGPDESSGVQLFRLLGQASENSFAIEEIVSGKRFDNVRIENLDDCRPNEGDVCLISLKDSPSGLEGAILGIMDADVEPQLHYEDDPSALNRPTLGGSGPVLMKLGNREIPDDEYGSFEDLEDYPDIYPDMYMGGDADDELDDDDFEDPDVDYGFGDFSMSPEEALDELAEEDRYARRKVIGAVLENYDEARDELMDWLHDDSYRDAPFPGAGEAPANAARIISEVGDMRALKRLLDVLGDTDPLGEEAPLALARLGPEAFACVATVLDEKKIKPERENAALWSLGFMAARHPCMRQAVLKKITAYLVDNRPSKETALEVLVQIRGVESLRKLRTACKAGHLDPEKFGYTWELLSTRVRSPDWGDTVAEAFIPLLELYPTEEELEELYASIEDSIDDEGLEDFEDFEDFEDPAALERLEDEMIRDMDEMLENNGKNEDHGDKESNTTRPGGKGGKGGKVIPFPPNNGSNKKDPEQ